MEHAAYVSGLRQLADFLEAHPDLGVPVETRFNVFPSPPDDEIRAHAARTCHILGKVKKEEYNDSIQLVGDVAGFTFLAWYNREQICERVEIGRKIVPATPRIEKTIIEEAVAEHEEVVYGWKCQPILGRPASVELAEPPALTDGGTPILEAEYVDVAF
jgi:hypothetical protein